MKKSKRSTTGDRKLAVIDFETDPFLYGRTPIPFAAGFYDGENYVQFWGTARQDDPLYDPMNDCVKNLITYILGLKEPHVIYAHNGGKFDFFYFLVEGALTNPALIINGRITKCGMIGGHELRDSYAIIPIPLAEMDKEEIAYEKMERDVREKNKPEILAYLKSDCVYLYDWVHGFREQFGNQLTVGATAMAELKKFHYTPKQNKRHDDTFRRFYFGGRVECFEHGEIAGLFKIFDVNSMYSDAMRNFDHPCGSSYIYMREEAEKFFDRRTGLFRKMGTVYFMRFIGSNKGALPVRITEGPNTGGLTFNREYGEFFACSHEIRTAIELGLVTVDKILEAFIPTKLIRFDKYVDHWSAEKIDAQKRAHKRAVRFAKFMLTSAYGKYATDPDKFREWYIVDKFDDASMDAFIEWKKDFPRIYNAEGIIVDHGAVLENDMGTYELWSAPSSDEKGYFDVAIAASITSAARSTLMRAIHHCVRPLYCDTDSLICEEIKNVRIDDTALGAWKFEGSTKKIYIAGKKMYGLKFEESTKNKRTGKMEQKEKIASKGAKLKMEHLKKLCDGEVYTWYNQAPNFKFSPLGKTKTSSGLVAKFVSRNIVANAKNKRV